MGQRILVVEDEQKIVKMIKEYLVKESFIVDVACDGEEALQKVRSFQPDLVVLDIMLPKKDGLEVLKELRRTTDIPVIMLTAKAEEVDKLLGLELGADDYITKPFSLRELAARIKVVLRRVLGNTYQPQNIQHGDLQIRCDSREVLRGGKQVSLTPTEFKILETLARNPGRVFTRLQLLDILGEPYYGYERSLDTHVSNLRKKIEPDPAHPTYILTVYGVGYKFGGETR
ncbi:MAG: response regulator transcription factor [Thermoanaerobacteraceae bacterium]|nr:response regulator transcription factor [Thermoanaerobacteraceae bacterium]